MIPHTPEVSSPPQNFYVPRITHVHTTNERLEFRLSGVGVSVANALRRTILSNIERIVLNPQQIEINTSLHFHNEIMKQRIRCVPVVPMNNGVLMTDEEIVDFVQNHCVDVDVKNTGSQKIYLTTGDFKIWSKTKQEYLPDARVREMFPGYRGEHFIDLMRLYPEKGLTIPGEQFKARIDFAIDTAQHDGCFSVVSKCSYQNTPDLDAADRAWAKIEAEDKTSTAEAKQYKKRDFYLLDAERYYVSNSFDFVVETNGIYENEDIVRRACLTLSQRFHYLKNALQENDETAFLIESSRQIEKGYDVILKNGDYTIGVLLDDVLFRTYGMEGTNTLSFCGFNKEHPHLKQSVLRMGFREEQDIGLCKNLIYNACDNTEKMFENLLKIFSKKRA